MRRHPQFICDVGPQRLDHSVTHQYCPKKIITTVTYTMYTLDAQRLNHCVTHTYCPKKEEKKGGNYMSYMYNVCSDNVCSECLIAVSQFVPQ